MLVKMEENIVTDASAAETSESFVVRMWQEDPGEWRGTVRHVQSQVQLGFTHVEQASRFIQMHTTGVKPRLATPVAEKKPAFHLKFGWSGRTRQMALVATLMILIGFLAIAFAARVNVEGLVGLMGH
jgi:hypothetical protein